MAHTLESRMTELAGKLRGDHPVLTAYREVATAKPTGTARAWFEAHNGRQVDTIQVTAGGVWAPLGRTVDASRASQVRLDGSRRDYAGLKVQHATADALIVTSDQTTEILYLAR